MEKAKLTPNQLRVIFCILESNDISEAAQKARVSRTTIYNFLKNEAFKKKLKEERNALFCEALDLLRQGTMLAAKELIELLGSKDETTRRLAAKEIINVSLKAEEVRDLEERISKIEQVIERERHRRWA